MIVFHFQATAAIWQTGKQEAVRECVTLEPYQVVFQPFLEIENDGDFHCPDIVNAICIRDDEKTISIPKSDKNYIKGTTRAKKDMKIPQICGIQSERKSGIERITEIHREKTSNSADLRNKA